MPRIALAVIPLLCAFGPAQQKPDEALLAKAREIHARVITLDTHKDIEPTLALQDFPTDETELKKFREMNDPTCRGKNQVDFPKMREGGYDCGFFIVYVGQGDVNPGAYPRALSQAMLKFDAIDRMCEHYGEHIGLARSAADVERISKAGKLIVCIGIENGYPMGDRIEQIAEFHRRGARYMGITHNGNNQLGDSHQPATRRSGKPPVPDCGGLSELGRRAIAEMNRVGIMVDVSHSAKTTMLQALELSKAPVIASHSGARALCDHTRNLDDEQLKALQKNGGVIQCVALADFVRKRAEGEPRASVKEFVDHIDHVVKTIGIDHVGIATDFDGGGGIDGWDDASQTLNVTIELVRRGYGEPQIAKIWSGNLLRVWREVEQVSAKLQTAAKPK